MKKPTCSKAIPRAALMALSLLASVGAQGAAITWGPATTIAADTDVSTSGTLIAACSETNTAVTVNTVIFPPESNASSLGNGAVSLPGGLSVGAGFGSNSTPFSTLSASYKQLLGAAASGAVPFGVIVLNNLTVGKSYQVQYWVNDSRGTSDSKGRTIALSTTGGNTVTLAYNKTQAPGGVGQYVIGTFTADATTQPINASPGIVSGSGSTAAFQVNAIQIRVLPFLIWNGGSTTGGYWSDAANWSGAALAGNWQLNFGGSTRLNNTNDTTAGTTYSDINFLSGAGAFVLNGNPITLGGNLTNSSANPQNVLLGLNFGTSQTIDGGSAGLTLGGGLTNTLASAGATKLTLAGLGTLTNLLSSTNSASGTNNLYFPSGANWTIADNAANAMMTVPWNFAVDGTLNFGSANTAPVVTLTPSSLWGFSGLSYNSIGTVSGAVGTLNVRGGNLMVSSGRLYTAVAANTKGVINVSGGALNIRGGLQCAQGSGANVVSEVNVSGGLLNMNNTSSGSSQHLFVATAGTGSLNVSGGTVSCVNLDVSCNQQGNTLGSVGTVNLDGGVITANAVTNASSGAQAGLANGTAATFNFNGGTLKARGTGTTVFQGHAANPALPIKAIVKAGGAVFDTGYALLMNEPLQHDPALGSSPDGGLRKIGSRTLALGAPCTYTGDTVVSAGTLALTNSGAIATTPNIVLSAGSVVFDVSTVSSAFSLGSAQTLSGFGTVSGATTINGTLAPGSTNAIGTLSFSSAPALAGTLVLKLNRSNAQKADSLAVTGTDTLAHGGTLVVTNIGPALQAGDSFTLLSAASQTGTFGSASLPTLGIGQNWWTTNDYATLTVNQLTAGTATYTRAKGLSLKIRIADLLTNVSCLPAGNNAFTLTAVSPSTNGATLTISGGEILFAPANDRNESVSYFVSDSRGGSATGQLNINVAAAVGAPLTNNIGFAAGTATVSAFGIPGYTYVLQTTTNLNGPWWPVATNTAAADGSLLLIDPNATNAQQYYRSAQP